MYVKRNESGRITAVSVVVEGDINEPIEPASAELAMFLDQHRPELQQSLEQSDLQMARVMEDVVNLLIDKAIIRFTDLPDAAQHKLMHRREMRGQFNAIEFLDDDEDDLGI